jgi:hypothetical protein
MAGSGSDAWRSRASCPCRRIAPPGIPRPPGSVSTPRPAGWPAGQGPGPSSPASCARRDRAGCCVSSCSPGWTPSPPTWMPFAPSSPVPRGFSPTTASSFDAPLLATRFRLAGLADPLVGLPHLDLLAPVRRAFGRCWPDCRLATAESRLLGLERRDDLPGAAAPLAWLGWLRRGETAPLARVLRHNRLDLCSLAGLLPRIDAAYADPASQGADLRAVAAHHREQGRLDLALALLAGHRRSLDPPDSWTWPPCIGARANGPSRLRSGSPWRPPGISRPGPPWRATTSTARGTWSVP